MDLQFVSDTEGNHTAVLIPIEQWNNLTAKHQDLKDLESPYNPEFVAKIAKSRQDRKDAKGRAVSIEELNALWK